MRLVVLVAALVLTAGCSGWKQCEHLEITTRNSAGKPQWLRYENARYRVLDTDPLTIEWQYVKCVDIESQAGTVEEICGRESQTEPVVRVAGCTSTVSKPGYSRWSPTNKTATHGVIPKAAILVCWTDC